MANATTFLGEIAVIGEADPDMDLGDFEALPNIGIVQGLAAEFADRLELMPYQEAGGPMRLSLCVYLIPKEGNGRVIAILSRDEYPNVLEGIQAAVTSARNRLEMIQKASNRYVAESVQSAHEALNKLSNRLRLRASN